MLQYYVSLVRRGRLAPPCDIGDEFPFGWGFCQINLPPSVSPCPPDRARVGEFLIRIRAASVLIVGVVVFPSAASVFVRSACALCAVRLVVGNHHQVAMGADALTRWRETAILEHAAAVSPVPSYPRVGFVVALNYGVSFPFECRVCRARLASWREIVATPPWPDRRAGSRLLASGRSIATPKFVTSTVGFEFAFVRSFRSMGRIE